MPYFICPNCANRSFSAERTVGFTTRPKGCERCGFGFLFELLDDYYPAPTAAFFTCDKDARILDCGRGSYELTALKDEDAIGHPIRDVLGLQFEDGSDQVAKALEWGIRVPDCEASINMESHPPKPVKADLFPAYDEDGGLLVVLTPK